MPAFSVSIDVEKDYRLDGRFTIRGITEGLPAFLDALRSHQIPFDLMISGEIADKLPDDLVRVGGRVAIGCHGFSHTPGYLNRLGWRDQEQDLTAGTQAVRSRFGAPPRYFRAPNFSANGETIRILEALGYRVDSSVLPGRYVRRFRILSLLDHRGAPEDPYTPDWDGFPSPGLSRILEVPVTRNPILLGGPLGLGYLHSAGAEKFRDAMSQLPTKYLVFLAHTWEMVSWGASDPVAPWVRSAASPKPEALEDLISSIDGYAFVNMEGIWQAEVRGANA